MNEYFIVYKYQERWAHTGPTTKTVRVVVEAETAQKAINATLDHEDILVDIRKL